jgi:hypothetical protein
MRKQSRADRNIAWIEHFCCFPNGPYEGRPVMLTPEEQQTVRAIYDRGEQIETVTGQLAAFLVLLHLCGAEARGRGQGPPCETDAWTIWRATSVDLQAVLTRRGEHVLCPELGTRFPLAA